jgi:hypothetical protein
MTETITVKRNIYTAGKVYADKNGRVCYLVSYHKDDGFKVLYFGENSYSFTPEINPSTYIGEIETVPLELEDGEWYMCDVGDGVDTWVTPYIRIDNVWVDGIGKNCVILEDLYNVKPLYKMVKAND